MYWHGPWHDLCRGPHLANTGQVAAGRLQADVDRRRLLARRPADGRCSAHLRHRLPHQGELDAHLAPAGGGGEARPPQARPRDGPVPPPGRGAGLGVLAPQRLHDLARAGGLHAPPARRRRLSSRSRRRSCSTRASGSSPATGASIRENMFVVPDEVPNTEDDGPVLSGKADLMALKPMNCPAHVQIFKQGIKSLPRPAAPHGRVRLLPPQRAARRAARADARAPVHPGRRAHLLPRGPDRRRDRGASSTCFARVYGRPRLDRHRHQARAPARQSRRHRRDLGPRRDGAGRRARRASRLDVRLSPPAKAPSTARSSSST